MDQYEWLHFESEFNFMIHKLCVKYKKSNIMTGNECRNWKASTLKGHAHSADDKQSVVAKAVTWSFSVSNVFNETSSHTLCTELQIPKLTNVWGSTNEIRRLYTFVSIRNPFTLLIYLNQFIDNKWLLNSLHHLKISRVFYNDITKKTCMIPYAQSTILGHLFFHERYTFILQTSSGVIDLTCMFYPTKFQHILNCNSVLNKGN